MKLWPSAVRRVLKYKQASSILKQDSMRHFFEQARLKFDLTLKVFATNHYIENTGKGKKKGFTQCHKKSTQCNEKSTQCHRLGWLEKG
jgi:hypothetical protein